MTPDTKQMRAIVVYELHKLTSQGRRTPHAMWEYMWVAVRNRVNSQRGCDPALQYQEGEVGPV